MNHTRIFTVLIIFFSSVLLCNNLFSQQITPQNFSSAKGTGRVTGIILDSLTNQPVEYGNFVLYRLRDSVLVYGTVSDKDGRFTVNNIPFGVYYARISFIGYKTRRKNRLVLSAKEPVVNIDTVRLDTRSFTTGEVQIVAQKERVVSEDDKIILKVDKTSGVNALDVLENAPMVSVDLEGNIKLMGREGTQIYIDGQPMKSMGFESLEDLKTLHYSEIEKIELIVNPSFEFSERSEGGAINIITKKISTDKYTGNSSVSMNTRKNLLSSAGVSYGQKNFTIRGNYANGYSSFNSESNSLRTINLNNLTRYIEQQEENQNNSNSNSFRLSLALNYDDNSIFSQFGYRNVLSDRSRGVINRFSENVNSISDIINNTNGIHNKQRFFNGSVSYSRQFEQKGKSLSANFSFMNNSMNLNNDLTQRNLLSGSELDTYLSLQNNRSENSNRTYAWSATYVQPVISDIRIRAGYKGSKTSLCMDNTYSVYNYSEQVFKEDLGRRSLQSNNKTFHSAFGSVNGSLFDFRFNLGLMIDVQIQESDEKVSKNFYKETFTGLSPSFDLSKRIFGNQNISLGYFRWYMYPQNRQLNPHVDYTDSTNLFMGNPDLKPNYLDLYNFMYSIPFGGDNLSISAHYADHRDVIEEITTQIGMKTSLTTYKNVASRKSYGAGISGRKTLFSHLSLDPEFSVSESRYTGTGQNSRNLKWSSGMRSLVSFDNFKFQMDFRYSSPAILAQEKSKPVYYMNAAVKALLFDKQLSVMLKAQDIFNTRNLNLDKYGTGYYSVNKIRQTTRIVSLDISYYFHSKANDFIEEMRDNDEYGDDF